MLNMTELTTETFQSELEKDLPLVVDFWASWCMPCKIFGPIIEEISDELDGKANFGKVDVDEEQELAIEYAVSSIPTLVIFQGGEEKERMVGVRQKEEVLEAIGKYL
jgi:thioredoxin 1